MVVAELLADSTATDRNFHSDVKKVEYTLNAIMKFLVFGFAILLFCCDQSACLFCPLVVRCDLLAV